MKLFKKIKNIIKSTILCIRFPFLYPRNRWDGEHHTNLLLNLSSKLRKKAQQEIYITVKLDKTGERYYDKIDFFDYKVRLDKTNEKLTIKNKLDSLEIDLPGIIWKANTFEILGVKLDFAWISGNPVVVIYVTPMDPEDKTNYGFGGRYRSLVISKWYNFWYKVVDWIDDNVLDKIFFLPSYTELDAMDAGWRKAFGIQMCKEIKAELKKHKFLYKYRITQIKEKFGCYDTETEVLTKDGWKYFKDVTKEDEIATLNSEEQLEYQKPTDVIAYNYEGPMYRLENRGVSLKVTPNHNLYVAKGSYYNGSKNNEKRVYPFELTTPETYFGKDKRFKKGCKWEGIVPKDVFKIPDYSYTNDMKINKKTGKRTYTKIGPEIEIKAFLRFLGFYVAEGYTNIGKGNGTDITVAYNPADEEELVTKLITDIGFVPKQSQKSKRFSCAPLSHWLKDNCGHLAPNKKVPEFIKQLSPEYIEEFLKYLFIGDGHQSKTANILTTTSKQLRDDVCELLLKCGHSFSYHEREPRETKPLSNGQIIQGKQIAYYINWLQVTDVEIDNSKTKSCKSFIETWENYNDMVYCVTVPNHVIYVRRNGKGVWCGNSLRWYDAGVPKDSKIWDIIDKYTQISYKTCVVCGKPATKMSTGWISPYCDDCIVPGRKYTEIK